MYQAGRLNHNHVTMQSQYDVTTRSKITSQTRPHPWPYRAYYTSRSSCEGATQALHWSPYNVALKFHRGGLGIKRNYNNVGGVDIINLNF